MGALDQRARMRGQRAQQHARLARNEPQAGPLAALAGVEHEHVAHAVLVDVAADVGAGCERVADGESGRIRDVRGESQRKSCEHDHVPYFPFFPAAAGSLPTRSFVSSSRSSTDGTRGSFEFNVTRWMFRFSAALRASIKRPPALS